MQVLPRIRTFSYRLKVSHHGFEPQFTLSKRVVLPVRRMGNKNTKIGENTLLRELNISPPQIQNHISF